MPVTSAWHLRQAVRILHAGGVVAYPTEGVFGLGCDPFDEQAVLRLLAIKCRPMHKGLILIASAPAVVFPLLLPQPEETLAPVLASWPGPSTWILPAAPTVPEWITGGGEGVAVRVTAHPLAAALCRAFGAPLVSTSANKSGRPAARSALGVRRAFGDRVDYVLAGAIGCAGPSQIRDARDGRLVRAGGGAS